MLTTNKTKPVLAAVKTVIGIDPGTQGGIAIIQGETIKAYKMRKFIQLVELFQQYSPSSTIVMVERVGAWQSDTNYPGKSIRIAKMVSGYQQILDALDITGISYMEIAGYSWQKKLKIWAKEEKDARKRRYKEIASKIFSKAGVKATLWNADALLIANYCHKLLHTDPILLKLK